jgi:GTP-binding protein EngB required for normal cell division
MSAVLVARTDSTRLDALAALATDCGMPGVSQEARALASRVGEGLFYVACVGQFKRGKSSLINALVGMELLPVGVAPVTSVVTIVRPGTVRRAEVRLVSGERRAIALERIGDYVTEAGNPGNRRAVGAVEAWLDHPLLATGMCLVDTPGVGSVFLCNTEATRAFVPHLDAALVVLGADPPLSAEELALIADIRPHCPHLLIVLNKADKLPESDRAEARAFTRRVLGERLGWSDAPVFEVSATEQLARSGPARDWPALEAALADLARDSGAALVQRAEARGFAALARRLQHALDDERGALERPLAESEARVVSLRARIAEADRALNDLGHLLSAEQERLNRRFAQAREAFIARATPGARSELAKALRTFDDRRGPALRRRAIAAAQTIARQRLDQWFAEAQPVAEELYVQAGARFVRLVNDFLDRLARTGSPELTGLGGEVEPEAGFRVRSRLYYTSLMRLTGQAPTGWLLDLIRPRQRQLAALEREVGAYLDALIYTNAHRIEGDWNDRLLESRRQLEFDLRRVLAETLGSAERAQQRARDAMAAGSEAVRAERARLQHLTDRLTHLADPQEIAV